MTINKLVRINGDTEDNIESKISSAELLVSIGWDIRRYEVVGGEQWFRNANLWYKLNFGYVNPYNNGPVHSELLLLHDNKSTLTSILKKRTFVFYGVGVGDTEAYIIDQELRRSKYAEVVGIDVNSEFLNMFRESLRNKSLEGNYKIMFKGYRSLFEQLEANDFIFTNSRYTQRAHICFGNTIGNYQKQNEIFRLFSDNSKKGDLLVLGFQLDTGIDVLFKKYSTNKPFADLILNWDDNPDYSKLEWELNRENGIIRADYLLKTEPGRVIEVFRSKKYNPDKLKDFVSNDFGYILLKQFIDNDKNSCIQIYEKT